MKFIVIIFSFFFLISCSTRNLSSTSLKSDSLIMDSKYYKGAWGSYFKTSKTFASARLPTRAGMKFIEL